MSRLSTARLELLQRRLARASGPATTESSRAEGDLGIAERRMWKIYQLDPESISHNIGLVLTFGGSFTIETVVASFELMIRNAAVLNSTIEQGADAMPRRIPADVVGRWDEPGSSWRFGRADAAGTDVHVIAAALAKTPFDLTTEPPLRARIQAGESGEVTVAFVVHHLAVDDSSWPILLGTLLSGVRQGNTDRVRPAAGGDVAAALRHAQTTWAAPDVRYPLTGALPADTPAESWLAPLVERRGDRLETGVDAAVLAKLAGVTSAIGATSNALLIALCALTVHAVTGAAEHVLLVPADNRRPDEDPSVVGYSGNIVPMRFSFDSAATVRNALRDAVGVVYAAMEFTSIDYGAVLTALRAAGGRFPVAEIMASVRNAPLRGIPVPAAGRVDCESVFTGIGNYPITMAFEIGADEEVRLELDYQPDVVDKATAGRVADTVIAFAGQVPESLDRTVGELVATVRAV